MALQCFIIITRSLNPLYSVEIILIKGKKHFIRLIKLGLNPLYSVEIILI